MPVHLVEAAAPSSRPHFGLSAPCTNGNLTNDGTRTYAYTSENRLTGTAWTNLWYEPLGPMHQLYHYQSSTEHCTRFDNLGDRVISETYMNTGRVRRYVHGPGTDEVLAWYENAQPGG